MLQRICVFLQLTFFICRYLFESLSGGTKAQHAGLARRPNTRSRSCCPLIGALRCERRLAALCLHSAMSDGLWASEKGAFRKQKQKDSELPCYLFASPLSSSFIITHRQFCFCSLQYLLFHTRWLHAMCICAWFICFCSRVSITNWHKSLSIFSKTQFCSVSLRWLNITLHQYLRLQNNC